VTNVIIAKLPPAPLHVFEIWSDPANVAKRFRAALGYDLPMMGRSGGDDVMLLMRFEPTVWLVEGEVAGLADILGQDGALTAIGGGIVRVRLLGSHWRTLLTEGGVFDAENPGFAVGCTAATLIDHVNVRLHVVSDDQCDAYVPLSFSQGLMHFWRQAASSLAT
jgi:heterotetrameric sarcosine oxidase gamma subunit